MYVDANVWSVIISIIAAVMVGYAFWKSTDFKEKDYRCLNLYEQYAGGIGKCIAEDTQAMTSLLWLRTLNRSLILLKFLSVSAILNILCFTIKLHTISMECR